MDPAGPDEAERQTIYQEIIRGLRKKKLKQQNK
jgi:hypothetical protein